MDIFCTQLEKLSDQKFKEYIEKWDEKKLKKIKNYLDDKYYNTSNSVLRDYRYDYIKDNLIKKDPSIALQIGAKIKNKENKVKLEYWMGSIDKITASEEKELKRWIQKNQCADFIITEKLDGISSLFISLQNKSESVVKLHTRGDGNIGSDISHIIPYIQKQIPKLNENIVIRGELIIKKNIFETKYLIKETEIEKSKKYKNARNMVSGLVSSNSLKEGVVDINFIAYEIIGDDIMKCPLIQLNKLKSLGFNIPLMTVLNYNDICMDKLISTYNNFKKDTDYDIDGLIIQSNIPYDRNTIGNPSYMFAFKMNMDDNIVETKVLDIEWSVTKYGYIIPVAILEPVNIQGVTISRVTLSNASLMLEKGIGVNSIIRVTRSNEVIPYVTQVLKKSEKLKYPNIEYEWDENNVNLIVANPTIDIIANMKIKLFSSFFEKLKIKFVSEQTIKKLYENGVDDLLKIISAEKKDILKVPGFQDKSAERIVTNIKKGLKNINLEELLNASGLFGYGIGKKRIQLLLTNIPDLFMIDKEMLYERILLIEGFSDIMAKKIIKNLDKVNLFINSIDKYITLQKNLKVSDSLTGKKFCFSGFRSVQFEKDINDRGGIVTTSVSKKTSALIISSSEGSTKINKAKECGVEIITKENFEKKYLK